MKRDRIRLVLEELECRALLSASVVPVEPMLGSEATHDALHAAKHVSSEHQTPKAIPAIHSQAKQGRTSSSPTALNPAWFTPDQIRQAYGFSQVPAFNDPNIPNDYNNTAGKGQTIAIVDVYDDPNILSDANVFSRQFGLPQFNTGQTNSPTFVKLNENNQEITNEPAGVPHPQTNSAWSSEISLDVEWAHAIAPQANIVLVEANSSSTSDVFKAMDTARNYPGVSVVSMSWGYWEGANYMRSNMPGDDAAHLPIPTPSNPVAPITYVAATLDNGSSPYENNVYWPAISPNVVGVGGTVLTLKNGGYGSETGWAYSTGGISKYEPEPGYQNKVLPQSTMRGNPDVSYAATNFAAYDTVGTYHGWFQAGGTSAGTPQWAALIALAAQERGAPLNSTQTLDALYQLAGNRSDFNDILTGSNGAYQAGTGYDLVTGLGTPVANQLI